ncbi:MAG: MFS transporter [Acidimicrobiia bacterium]
MSTVATRTRLGAPYRLLWLATAISNLGDGITRTAAPLLAASLTRDPRLVAGLTTALMLPWLLFALPSGAVVDRLDRRLLMTVVEVLRGLVMVGFALSVAFGGVRLFVLYLVFFLIGVGETLYDTSADAMVPSVVGPDRFEDANGWMAAAETGANDLLGPAIGGAVYAAAIALPFFLDAVSFALSAGLVLAMWKTMPAGDVAVEVVSRERMRHEIAEGMRWLRDKVVLRRLAIAHGIHNLYAGAIFAVMVLYATRWLHLGSAQYGLFLAVVSLGGVVGGLIAGPVVHRIGRGPALVVCVLAEAAGDFVTGVTHDAWLAVVAGAIGMCGWFVWSTVSASLRQLLTPDALLGRLTAAYRFVVYGPVVVGATAGGFVVQATDEGMVFRLSGLTLGVIGVWSMFVFGSRRARAEEPSLERAG